MQSSPSSPTLRIGTRGSPLALAQARLLLRAIAAANPIPPETIALEVIRTTGDMIRDRPLAELGGKGLFTKEIEEALLTGAIDAAVHSAKDMETALPEGLAIAATLRREDARDAFVSRDGTTLRQLLSGSRVGTASLRRQALVKRLRADLVVVPLRGNVETRLRKLEAGEVDAILLALAGLKRLGRADVATAVLDVDEFPPAVGQGVIAVEARLDDARTRALLERVNHAETASALVAERAFLAALDGSCRTPIGGHATVQSGRIELRGLIAKPDGSEVHQCVHTGPVSEAAAVGRAAGNELKERAGADFFRQLPSARAEHGTGGVP
ncbi:MAG TPA: hydroxymethylbilane synthase [Xanthobacteraceae bacterium]